MHILFLSQVLPYPLDAGPKTRAYYTLRYLAQDHDVTLLTFVRANDTPEAIDHLRAFCRAVHTIPMTRSRIQDIWHLTRSVAGSTPFLIRRDWLPAMNTTLRRIVQNGQAIDALHADQLWMASYALEGKQLANGDAPLLVLDQHNAVFQIPRRLAHSELNPLKRALLRMESSKLLRYERDVCAQFDHVVWVTGEDYAALQATSTNGDGRATVIPICVDPTAQPVVRRRPSANRITFLGGLHWPPNAAGVTWFVRDVWPRVSHQLPDIELTIIGKDPPAALVQAAGGDPRIVITGYVSDLQPYLEATGAFIIPLHAGGGMRVKLLDAWAWGLPVVSTTIGAEGVNTHNGENIVLADTPDAFARAVTRVLTDEQFASRLAHAGRDTVEREYDWRTVYRRWDQVYAQHRELTGSRN